MCLLIYSFKEVVFNLAQQLHYEKLGENRASQKLSDLYTERQSVAAVPATETHQH